MWQQLTNIIYPHTKLLLLRYAVPQVKAGVASLILFYFVLLEQVSKLKQVIPCLVHKTGII